MLHLFLQGYRPSIKVLLSATYKRAFTALNTFLNPAKQSLPQLSALLKSGIFLLLNHKVETICKCFHKERMWVLSPTGHDGLVGLLGQTDNKELFPKTLTYSDFPSSLIGF